MYEMLVSGLMVESLARAEIPRLHSAALRSARDDKSRGAALRSVRDEKSRGAALGSARDDRSGRMCSAPVGMTVLEVS
jgi:hypothetical protein